MERNAIYVSSKHLVVTRKCLSCVKMPDSTLRSYESRILLGIISGTYLYYYNISSLVVWS